MAKAYTWFKNGVTVQTETTGRKTELPHGNPASDGGVTSKLGPSVITGK